MFRVRRNAGIAALVVAIGVVPAVVAPAGASSRTCGGGGSGGSGGGIGASQADGSGGTGLHQHHRRHRRTCAGKYVNPVHARAWLPGRIDMGVDYSVTKRKPVVAIGDAKIIGSDSHSGWPGGHFIWYRLLDGDHAGNIVYVAETLAHLAPKGKVVSAGQPIATALPSGTGSEWGWANKAGSPRAAPCYSEGMKTNSGREFARFIRSLGGQTGDKPGPGPARPAGKRC